MTRWDERVVAAEIGRKIKALLEGDVASPSDLFEIVKYARAYQVEYLANHVVTTVGKRVLTGPFRGLELLQVQIGSLLLPKILGTYESEIGHLFTDLERFDRLVDVGFAEGYYAVGVPFAFPHMRSIGFDTSPAAHRVCAAAATLNRVSNRVELRTLCTPDDLTGFSDGRTLIVIDIDGGEIDLLCAQPSDRLRDAELIVEVHTNGQSTTGDDIIPHFEGTHDVTVYRQQVKDAASFDFLKNLSSNLRMLATWEGRKNEAWLHLRPKAVRRTDARLS